MEKSKIPNKDEVEECLENVDETFREALGYRPSKKSKQQHDK
jgi:hypothetical protein